MLEVSYPQQWVSFLRPPHKGGFRMKLELIDIDRQKPPIVLHQFPVIVGFDPTADIVWTIPPWAITTA